LSEQSATLAAKNSNGGSGDAQPKRLPTKTAQATSSCLCVCVTFDPVAHGWTLTRFTDNKTTLSALRFVGQPLLTSQWFSRFFIDFLTEFVSAEMDLGRLPLRIEISEWIQRVEKLHSPFGIDISSWRGLRGLFRIAKFMRRMQDPSFAEPLFKQLTQICLPEAVDAVRRNLENLDFAAVNRLCNEMLRKAGAKGTFDAVGLLAITRATQTVYRCLARYRLSPISLIQDARNGDRRAVLDLVKIDKLFLLDNCTQDVLQKALLSGDKLFTEQLARAQLFKPTFTRRQACEIYMLFLAGSQVRLPTLARLKMVLDPDGESFPGRYDFEKCFERRQREVQTPLAGCGKTR
jgi:hypothetical protein